ncbi:MAG: hypothetical protein M0Z39_04130 [Actinomycetota bacterium]|nr:hypothetical protein [Actinomycetota bacterium]
MPDTEDVGWLALEPVEREEAVLPHPARAAARNIPSRILLKEIPEIPKIDTPQNVAYPVRR